MKSELPILYIRRACPWCRDAMSFFSQHGIELEVRDVEHSKQNMDAMVQISEQEKVPTLVFGEFVVADFDLDELHDELEQNPEVKRALGLGVDDE